MFTIIAQKTTTLGSAATTSRIIERKKGRASSLIIARAEPAKPKLKKAVSLFFVRNENFWMCAIETNARDFLSLSLSFNQNRRILRLVVAVREGTATSRRLRTRSKSAKVRVLEKKKKMIRSVFVSQIRVIILCVASLF